MEANSRETKNINAVSILDSATTSDRDTYVNLSGTVASLMAELVPANKNLVEALKENTCLERVIGLFHKRTSPAVSYGETGRGGTPQQKKGPH